MVARPVLARRPAGLAAVVRFRKSAKGVGGSVIAELLSPNRDDEPSGTVVPAGVARGAGDNSPPDLEEGT